MSRKVSMIVAILALLMASLPGVASAAGPKFTPGSPGIGDPYFPTDGNGGYDVAHYDLVLSYDPATDELTGVETITAKATQNLSAFNLDFVGLDLHKVTVDGATATTNRVDSELTITPKHGLEKGKTFTVVANYDGVPVTLEDFGLSGFIHTDDGAIAIGEPHVAATWFPANDHPRDKASFHIAITVPEGTEAVSNGVLKGQKTKNHWTTWTWDAKEPMATYLAFMAVGQFDIHAYQKDGIKFWDAIDPALLADKAPPITPVAGSQFLYSQVADLSYKRLTRTIDRPGRWRASVVPGQPRHGARLGSPVRRDAHCRRQRLDDVARRERPHHPGHGCLSVVHIRQPLRRALHHGRVRPIRATRTIRSTTRMQCQPHGSTGDWNAASGLGDGWEHWSVAIPNTGATSRQVEVSITYESDQSFQGRGVAIDDLVISTGEGSTSFENRRRRARRLGRSDLATRRRPTTRTAGLRRTSCRLYPETSASRRSHRSPPSPKILAFESSIFGKYPFSASGGVIDNVEVGFALENQTRPTYSPFFFFGPEANDFVIVHELAHEWYGDSLSVDTWQNIWLNEGFATYAEWLWSEREGFGTAQENFDGLARHPRRRRFLEAGDRRSRPGAALRFPGLRPGRDDTPGAPQPGRRHRLLQDPE